jgi:hypothetical protein
MGIEYPRTPRGITMDWDSVGRYGDLRLQHGNHAPQWDGCHRWC